MAWPRNTFTLVEMLVSVFTLGLIAAASAALLSATLDAQAAAQSRAAIYREGLIAMERMTAGVRVCSILMIPNGRFRTRTVLAFSGSVNEDSDFFFGDPLFPRIDEDVHSDADANNKPGLAYIDDDYDGGTDENLDGTYIGQDWYDLANDDEDSEYNEDWIDGRDNDGDGTIDEDMGGDMNDDGFAGIRGVDDDGDGLVDEIVNASSVYDDDEDGLATEDVFNPILYVFDANTNTLREENPATGQSVELSDRVVLFQASYAAPGLLAITLSLQDDDGRTVTFSETICARNVLQRTGRRVR